MKKAMVYGAGVSGLAACELLRKNGYEVILVDDKKGLSSKEAMTQLDGVEIFIKSPGIPYNELVLEVKNKGIEYFENTFVHKFDNATTVGLLLTLVLIFASQTEVILSNPLHIVLIAVPLTVQTVLIFFIAYSASKIFGLSHDIAAPAGMIGASNFFELAVAVAIALFGTTSPAALATTVGVLTEVPVMLALVKVANSTRGWFKK